MLYPKLCQSTMNNERRMRAAIQAANKVGMVGGFCTNTASGRGVLSSSTQSDSKNRQAERSAVTSRNQNRGVPSGARRSERMRYMRIRGWFSTDPSTESDSKNRQAERSAVTSRNQNRGVPSGARRSERMRYMRIRGWFSTDPST